MPLGIDLPDIHLPDLNPFDDDGKKKKKKRPRVPESKKKKEEYGPKEAAKDLLIPGRMFGKVFGKAAEVTHAPRIVRSGIRNVAEMGEGLIPAAGVVGRAAWHDKNLSLKEMFDSKDDLRSYYELLKWTVADEKGDKRKQPKTNSEMAGIVAAMLRGWGRSVEKAIPDPTSWEDIHEASKYWQDDPVFAALDLIPVGTMVTRPLSIAKHTREIAALNDIQRGNRIARGWEAGKAGFKESYHPGTAKLKGLKGGIEPRVASARIGEREVIEAGRPWSRNPLMREFQGIYDNIFNASEGLSQRRVGRLQERAAREEKRRIDLDTERMTDPVAHMLSKRLGRMQGAFGLRSTMNATERRRATALGYIFQSDRNLPFDKSLAAVEEDLSRVLQDGHIEIQRGKRTKRLPLTAEDKQNLATQISDINLVRQELKTGKLSEQEMFDSLDGLGEIASKSREMGEDILRGYRRLNPDEMAEVTRTWDDRAGILHRRMQDRGIFGKLEDSPARAARIKEFAEKFPGQEDVALDIADRLAQRIRPEDPGSWWEDRVGATPEESIADFQQRMAGGGQYHYQPGVRRTVEGMVEEGVPREAYYFSPLQRWVDDKMPKRMPARDLENVLVKNIPKEEFYNAGLDLYFDAIPDGAAIYKTDFQNFLANPMNAYNLEEQVLVYGNDLGHDTKWNHWGSNALNSRDPHIGEYREILMKLPGEKGRDLAYRGKGYDHWDQNNVVAHVRYHVFEEDGKRKLLIEEIQSDWASDVRKARKRGEEYKGEISEDAIREIELLQHKADELTQNIEDIRDDMYRLNDEIRNTPDTEREALYAEYDRLDDIQRSMRDHYYDLVEEQRKLGDTGLPPSPLGEKYYRAIIRRIGREAADENVDEIILVDPTTQVVRNAHSHEALPRGEAGVHPADVRAALSGEDHGAWTRNYGKNFPEFIRKEYGVTGEYSRAAYEGRYSTQGGDFSMLGDLPGTVFKVTDDMRAKASRPQPLYQTQPNWGGLPRGANELLQGKNLIHIFDHGDISTWIHELGHSALYDLADEDLHIVESHIAGGRPLAQWTTTDSERFARSFETYMREGKAPSGALHGTFQKLKQWIGEVWKIYKETGEPLDPEVRQVFDRMMGGPTGKPNEPWGYLPHRDFTEMAQQEYRGGVRPAAAGQVMGRPRLAGDTLQRHKNELILYQTGRLSLDPKQLVDVFLRRMRFQETLRARDELWDMGTPLSEGKPPKGAFLIRNPDATAKRIHPSVQAAVRGEPTDLPSRQKDLDRLDEMDADLIIEPDDFRKDLMAKASDNPVWARDQENVRWVPGDYVQARFGEVFEQRPRGKGASALSMLNSLQRITGIYGRPISYVGGNWPFNAMALLSSMPVSTMVNAGRAFKIRRSDPELFIKIASETGETRASAGLPNYYVGAQNAIQQADRRVSQAQRAGADYLSKVADTPFRVTAFLNNAAKRGYKTNDELRDLIDEGGSELSDIRQRTRDQMLDFDALNPAGRRAASTYLYLWPFIYASIKWPAMFAREYPLRAALAAQGMKEYREDAPQSIANLWQEHGVDLSTLNPMGPLGEISEQLYTALEDPTKLDLTVLQERLSPTLAAAVEGMSGGSKNALQNYIRQTIPGAAEIMAADPRFRGGKQYADQTWGAYLKQRHARFWPRGINHEVIKERVDQWRKDQISTDTHKLEMGKDKEKINEYVKAIGGYAPEDITLIQTSYKSWWDYQEAVDQKKDSTGQRKLTPVQTTEILDEIVRENYPEYRDELYPMEVVRNAKDMSTVEAYNEELKKIINEGRQMVFDDYRSYAAP